MDIFNELAHLNWLAVIAATIVTMALGTVWYGPLFGKKWMQLEGLTKKEVDNADGMPQVYAQMGVIALLTSIVMAVLAGMLGVTTVSEALLLGLLVGVVLRGATHYIHDGFSHRKPGVTFIHASYDVAVIVLVTLIVGLWR